MKKFLLLIIGIVLFIGCANNAPGRPINTFTPSTLTPSYGPTVSSTPTMPISVPTPMTQDPYGNYIAWGDIPMMPGATTGHLEGRKYFFEIKAKPVDVKAYYEKELQDQGYTLVKISPDPTVTSDPDSPFQFVGWNHQLLTCFIKYINETSYVEIDFGTYGSYY